MPSRRRVQVVGLVVKLPGASTAVLINVRRIARDLSDGSDPPAAIRDALRRGIDVVVQGAPESDGWHGYRADPRVNDFAGKAHVSTAAQARSARIKSYVATLSAELPTVRDEIRFATAALALKRKLSTIMRECGYRAINAQALAELDAELTVQRVYTDRALSSAALRRADWVSFSRLPFPPDELFFAKEAMLKEYLRAGVGNFGPLKELTLVGVEFPLPSGRLIDLLCQERRRDNKGALVAIELKKSGKVDGVVTQLSRYLEELSQHPLAAGRPVRGIIVSGRADEIEARQPKGTQPIPIDWYVYSVKLERMGSTA